MLLYLIAVPIAFLVAQGFRTLVAYIFVWCGFPNAGYVVFWAFASLGAISALAWTHNLIAARQRLVQLVHWLRTVTRQRGENMFSWNPIGRMFAGWYGTCRLWCRTWIL